MNKTQFVIISSLMLSVFFIPDLVFGDVFVPEHEFLGYFDTNDIYTVVGAVKNTEDHSVVPTLYLTISQGGKLIHLTQNLPTVFPNKDIPFKIKIPEIVNPDVVLGRPQIKFEKILDVSEPDVEVLYDKSLVKRPDGSLVGRIINKGNFTEYDIKVYATIHGENNTFIDVAQNMEKIHKIEPGQILYFTMHPDPKIAEYVHYYSCFALGDETIVPLYAIKSGERFDFRYDSTAAFTVNGFDESGTSLSLTGINSFKVPTYVNFEFPRLSENEKFSVLVNQVQVKSIQSLDDDSNWHVAFDIDASSQNQILISGFERMGLQNRNVPNPSITYDYLYYVMSVAIIGAGLLVYWRKKIHTKA